MRSRSTVVAFACVGIALAGSACEEGSEESALGGGPSSAPVGAAAPITLTREITLDDAMKRARLAFRMRPEDGAYDSGTDAWYARSVPGGVTFVPLPSRMGELPGHGVTIRTAEVRRGAWSWPAGAAFTSDAQGMLTRGGSGTNEWIRGTDEGIEQGWTFDVAPNGDGPIVVTVALDGAVPGGADLRGLHMETESGGVVYGHGTWIDADGVRTAVPVQWVGDQARLEVPSHVVDSSAYPATLDPVVGPEQETDPGIVGPDDNAARQLFAACTASTCMALYQDDLGIRRIRFGVDGTLLDSVPILFTNAAGAVPRGLTTVGNQFVALWRTGATSSTEVLHVQRFDESGALLGGEILPSSNVNISAESIACSTDRCLVVWRASSQVLSQRFDASGAVVDPFGTLLVAASPTSTHAVWNGSSFVVSYGPTATRISNDGVNLHPAGLALGFTPQHVATNGSTSLFVRSGNVRIINADGTLGTLLAPAGFFNSVAWTGDRYLAVSANSPTSLGQAFDGATGAALGPAIIYDGPSGTVFTTSRPGGAFVGVSNTTYGDAWLRPVDAGGAPTAPLFWVNSGTNPQHAPVIIAGNGQYLAAWLDKRLGAWGIYAQRWDASGSPLDATPFLAIPVTTFGVPIRSPAGAFDGTNYLLVSCNGDAARVSPAGVVLDPGGFELEAYNACSVSWDGQNYVTASHWNGESVRVEARRVTPGGTVLDPAGILIYSDSLTTASPGIASAFNGTAHLVVWRGGGTFYRQLSPGGTLIGNAQTTGASFHPMPRLACLSSGSCLLTNGVTFRTLSPSANVAVPGAPVSAIGPAGLALGGSEYLVVTPPLTGEVTATRLSATQPPAPIGGWFQVSQSPTSAEIAVSAAALGDGSALVAYERPVPEENSHRVFLRAIVLASPAGAACTAAADCQSNFCVDGVCCNAACGNGATNDCQACSVAAGAAADGTCSPVAAGSVCRAANGDCDAAETCDGSATACPVDGFQPSSVVCRTATDQCDVAESCSGASAACPADALAPSTQICRPASGDCDVADACTGASAQCPADVVVTAGTTCRISTGICDAEEACDGSATACPIDAAAPPTTVCRTSADLCDAEETCGGAFVCPPDEVESAGVLCRMANGDCDVDDFCDGSSPSCTNDGAPVDTPCGGAPAGDCDLQDTCSGGPGDTNECTDWVQDASVTCRDAAGDCDQAEACTGAAHDCPADEFADGTTCRESMGACDAEEQCDGSGADCPADAAEPDGTPCGEALVCSDGDCIPDAGEGGAGGGTTSSSTSSSSSSTSGSGSSTSDSSSASTGSGDGDDGNAGGGSGGDDEPEDGGCSCRSAGQSGGGAWALALVGLVVAARPKRRRRGTAPRQPAAS